MADQQYPDPEATGAGAGAGLYMQNGVRASSQDVTDPTLQSLSDFNAEQEERNLAALQQHNHGSSLMDPPVLPSIGTPQRVAQTAMSLDGGVGPGFEMRSNQRKRTKTTRACDECRRKKIRCDSEDGGPEACSSCKRTGAPCRFSRTPQKRGPSKGYIKELADRVASLENLRLRAEAANDDSRDYSMHPASPGTPDLTELARHLSESRKRTFSMSEDHQASASPTNQVSAHGETHSAGEDGFTRNSSRVSLNPTEYQQTILDTYYATIHYTLPLLPSQFSLLGLLSECQAIVRDAFIQSLDCAVRHFVPAGTINPQPDLVKKTKELLGSANSALSVEDDSRRASNHLIFASSHILMAIEAGQRGPNKQASRQVNQHIFSAASAILQDAESSHHHGKGEPFLRVFSVLTVIDRFNMITQSQESAIDRRYDSLLRKFRTIEPEAAQMNRIAEILGNIRDNYQTEFIRRHEEDSTEWKTGRQIRTPLFKTMILTFLDLVTDNLGDSPSPTLQLACQHVNLIMASISESSTASELISETSALVDMLLEQASTKTVTPLQYHFAALATVSLLHLLKNSDTRDEATRISEKLDDAIISGGVVPLSQDGKGWDTALSGALRKTRPTSSGLARLADAAIERNTKLEDEENDGSAVADPSDVSAMATAAAISASQAHMALQLHNTGSWEPASVIRDGITSVLSS